jgi:hypothetical protein
MSEQNRLASVPTNSFLRGSISSVFIRTSLPIILVTMVNGMLLCYWVPLSGPKRLVRSRRQDVSFIARSGAMAKKAGANLHALPVVIQPILL